MREWQFLAVTRVEINVVRGWHRICEGDNKSLSNFWLDGIPRAPNGDPRIEVKYEIEANGIAVDKGTGKKQDITITSASTLPGDEVFFLCFLVQGRCIS